MGDASTIEWTDSTWNPWRGCKKVDPTCASCYMFTAQRRYGRDPHVVTRCSPGVFNAPLSPRWARKRAECIADHGRHLVFTCSWSDWFHEDADAWRAEAWDIIRRTPDSVFQILTSRPERIADHLPDDWGAGYPNVWMGVTIGNRRFVHRADLLRAIPATVRFLSCEPLLGPLFYDDAYPIIRGFGSGAGISYRVPERNAWRDRADLPQLDLTDIDWVIVGGESGGRPGRRLVDTNGVPIPERERWVRDIRDACLASAGCLCRGSYQPVVTDAGCCAACGAAVRGTAFLFKQWGGPTSTSSGRLLDGRTWDEMPPLAPVAVR